MVGRRAKLKVGHTAAIRPVGNVPVNPGQELFVIEEKGSVALALFRPGLPYDEDAANIADWFMKQFIEYEKEQ